MLVLKEKRPLSELFPHERRVADNHATHRYAILLPLQHHQPGGLGVFRTRRYDVAPYEGTAHKTKCPGKPWAEWREDKGNLGHSIAPEGLQDSAQGFNPGKLQFSGTP